METPINDTRLRKYACLIIGLVVFLYCVLRAYLVPITHDEAYTYLNYVHDTLWDTLAYNHSPEPNNHSFNSAVAMFFNFVFGGSPFALRLFSLIACLVFLYYTYKLVNIILNTLVAISSYILLLSNPYMLDYFSLCRGYAPGLACMMASLYYLYQHFNSPGISARQQFKAMLPAGLMPCFHLSFLNYFLPFCAVVLFLNTYKVLSAKGVRRNIFWGIFKTVISSYPLLIIAILTLSYTLPVVFFFKGQNQFDFAGAHGFWYDTVGILFSRTLYYYDMAPNIILYLSIIKVVVVIIFTIACFYWVYRKSIDFRFWVFLLLIVCSLSSFLQFHLLGINYPIDRTALFFGLLLFLCFVYAFDYASRVRKIFIAPFLLTVVFFCGVTVKAGNFSYALNWWFDAGNHLMLKDLENLNKANYSKSKPLKLGIDWLFEPAINYYRIYDKMDWLGNVTRKGLDASQDYYFVFIKDYKIDSAKVKIVKIYPDSIALIQNLHPFIGDTIAYENQDFETAGSPGLRIKGNAHSGQYSEMIGENETTDRLKLNYPVLADNDSLMVYVSAWIKSGKFYNKGAIILAVNENWYSERTGNDIIETNDWERISFETGIPANKVQGKKIEIWVNNYGRGSFYVDDIEVLITKIPKNGNIMALHKK